MLRVKAWKKEHQCQMTDDYVCWQSFTDVVEYRFRTESHRDLAAYAARKHNLR